MKYFLLTCLCTLAFSYLSHGQSTDFDLTPIGSYDTGIFDEGAAEIVAYDPIDQKLFFTNAKSMSITILDIRNPALPELVADIDMSGFGGDVNSVAVKNGLVAVAVAANDKTQSGTIVFMNTDGEVLHQVQAGALPDMVTFNRAGTKLLVANEGEPNDDYTIDPQGSVSIIDISNGVTNAKPIVVSPNVYRDVEALRSANIRIFGPNANSGMDLEPEYITVSEDDKTAYAICQENNTILKINLERNVLTSIHSLGYKDFNLPGNEIDASDRSEGIQLKNWKVLGMYQPDAIKAVTINGQQYFVSANEGDARDYDGFSEEARVKDLVLDLTAYPNAEELQQDENLGRLKTTTTLGDTDGDGDVDQIYAYGGRSFSIWDENANLVWDSGADFIKRLQTLEGDNYVKNRSDDKGSEPEAIEIAKIDGKTFAIIALERQSGLFAYDISNPTAPIYVNYFRNETDIAPEDVVFIPAEDSPSKENLIVTANEVSGTITIFRVGEPNTEGEPNELFDASLLIKDFTPTELVMPPSPLTTQVLFVGGYDIVQTTSTYGNPAGRAVAKEWHDFIGFTPDETGASLGWVSVNHEQIYRDDRIGDGGGMTAFRIKKDADGQLEVMNQTLEDGRSGEFFNVDFVNTVGETGMNCAGITAPDGRIWTAEEWFRTSTASIYNGVYRGPDRPNSWNPHNPSPDPAGFGVRDTSAFTIDAPEFPLVDGMTINKYENFNYMVEIDPKQAKAIRKQYNWGRAGWEGGAITDDMKTVYLGMDATPAPWVKFEAETAGDFTKGTVYVYKHDNPRGKKWIAVPESVENMLGGLADYAWSVGATMFNRNEWVTIDRSTGMVYWTETGRDKPGSRWADEAADGGQYAPHHVLRAFQQGASHPGDSEYWDYYGRVLSYNPATEGVDVMIEGGPYFADGSPIEAAYPEKHLSNPDGLNVLNIDGQSYLMIQEDLNGTSFGRTPEGVSNRLCELYLLSTEHRDARVDDLIRITAIPAGAEVTGAIQVDDNTILVNAQHPNANNPFPFNHSLTMAIHGFADLKRKQLAVPEFDESTASIIPNAVTRELQFKEATDFAIYDQKGNRLRVYRNRDRVSVADLPTGVYFLQNTNNEIFRFSVNETTTSQINN
ncbi:MAG: choice-of-anchor I family protein [Bacteroidota bacterium]